MSKGKGKKGKGKEGKKGKGKGLSAEELGRLNGLNGADEGSRSPKKEPASIKQEPMDSSDMDIENSLDDADGVKKEVKMEIDGDGVKKENLGAGSPSTGNTNVKKEEQSQTNNAEESRDVDMED